MTNREETTIRFSNRQFKLLNYLKTVHNGKPLGLIEIAEINQTTLGSLKRRHLLAETKDRQGVQLTRDGLSAIARWNEGDFLRSVVSTRFSSFLSLDVYEERKSARKGPQRVEARQSAVA